MKNLFQKASSPWVRYSEYEYKKAGDGYFYITPAAGAEPEVYDPLKDAERMVLDAPQAVSMSFQREYAERYDWLARQFKDLAFSFYSSFLYYNDYDVLDEMTRDLYRQGMAAFGGIAPTYHIALLDRPTIIWDFHSLLLCLQMMFSFMLTDADSTLKACKHCNKIFTASRPNAEFCSPQCKNRYNVYKSRGKE